MDNTLKPTFVCGARVSARTRHKDNRQQMNINIPITQLNAEYGGSLIAHGEVRKELNRLGFDSTYSVIKWQCIAE